MAAEDCVDLAVVIDMVVDVQYHGCLFDLRPDSGSAPPELKHVRRTSTLYFRIEKRICTAPCPFQGLIVVIVSEEE